MKKITLLFLCFTGILFAQKKEITLDDLWTNYSFYPRYMNSLDAMNGSYYSLLNRDRNGSTTVDKYSYKTLEKISTIVSSASLDGIDNFSSYTFNADESKVLLGTDEQQIYRHSSKGIFYAYDLASKSMQKIADAPIQEPLFSPDSKKVAYMMENNLYIKNLENNTTIQVTKDGKKNEIINGITDWVYEEEFAFVRAFDWNSDSNTIAFLKFDEREVPEFSMDLMGGNLYPSQQVFKYPKAGEKNAVVSLHLFSLKKEKTKTVALGDYEYLPRIKWTKDPNVLYVTTLNRHQNDLYLKAVDAKKAKASTIIHETDAAYIDITDNLTFLDDNSFIWTSEKDGFNHIYHYSKKGKLLNQITKGDWEVSKYYGFDKESKQIFYQSTEPGSINRGVYSIQLNGKKKKALSTEDGMNDASFSKDMAYYINEHSSATIPLSYTLYKGNGTKVKEISNNAQIAAKLKDYNLSPKEFSTISINGNDLNMWMIKPSNFDPNKKYPLFLYQYSGPGSQSVQNSWHSNNDYWHQMLAQKGIIVACIDGRGTGGKGAAFKKVTQKELGKYEVEDQIAVAKKLGNKTFIDANRIGIWGWSFGGFMSSNCILKGNDVFSMAIAVAPVSSWRYYDSVYTERYMTTPQENASGYDENSPIQHVDKLKGKYLIVHGTGDDNVHVQNAYEMINALVKADKDFEMAIYPDRAHGIYKGKNTRLHLYKKMTKFIEENL